MKDKLIFFGVAIVAVIIGVLFIFVYRDRLPTPLSPVIEQTGSAATTVPFTRIVQGTKSSVAERVNYLITSSSQMTELWKMTDATGTPPAIDFKTHAVLAIFAGKEPCSGINVAKIEDASARTVSITLAKPDGACADKVTGSSPYEIVVVEATPLPLTHADISTTVSCPKS